MKLTIKQWYKLERLAACNYYEKSRKYQEEKHRLLNEGKDEWEIGSDEFVNHLYKLQNEAYELWQALATQEI